MRTEKFNLCKSTKKLLTLITLLTLGVGQMWAGHGYNDESHVYLNVNGTTKYYKVSTESWSTGSSLPGTWGGVLKDQTFNNVLYIQVKGGAVGGWCENDNISGNLYYKVTNNTTTPSSGWTSVGGINANYTTKSGNNCFRYKNDYSVNVTPTTPGTYYLHIKITDGDSNNRTSYVKIVVPSFTVAGTEAVLESDWDATDTDNDMTFSSGTTYTLTKSNVTLSTGTTYECKVVLDHSWSTSYPGSNKTFTVAANGLYNVTFTFDASNQSVSVSTTRLYAVIYNDNGKTSGSVPATSYHANGATVTVASNSGSLAKTGYSFGGWNTNSSGTGTNYTAGSGTFTMGSSDKNLFAKWTENMSTVSFVASPTGKGTFQVNSSTVTSTTAGVTTTRSVTAVPIDGYHFVSWAITGGATISSTTTNPTTVTGKGAGEDATLTATFAADDVYSLTVAAGTGISAVSGNTNDIKAGQNIAISATVATGYTWSTWTKTAGSGTLSTFTAGTRAQTVTVGTAGDITLTASATETMRTITINGGTTATTTAGVSTKGTATAAAPAAGKKFTGWSLGDGVSLADGYALTDRTIKFTATQASSVTANYANRAGVKMYFAKPTTLSWSKVYAYAWGPSSHNKDYPGIELENTEVINCVTYYTYQYYTEADGIGGAATGDATWNKIVFGDNADARKTGDLTISNGHYYYKTSTGTGQAAAITSAWGIKTSKDGFAASNFITHNCATNSGSVDISFTGGNNYTFKVYNEVNDQWWSNSAAMGSSNPVTASMAAAQTLYNDDANNMQVNAALTGSYTFTVASTNTTTPTIKVTFPEIYAIVGSFNSWNSETNPLSMDGNTGTASIVLAPSGSNYTLKVVDNGAMYGKNSTTITGTTTVSSLSTSEANINLTADIYPASANPSYTFSYNKSTKALTVTYPAAHTVTYGVGTHAGTASVTSSISVASGKKILDTQSITFSKGDTKTGYTWKGWYNNTSGSSSALGTDATYTSSSRAANTSVYACYNLVTYTITYNLNGGSNPVSPAPATSFTIESAAITLPTPSKTGYTFNGWYENADLSTGGVKTTIPAGSTGNKVYYAKWTPITYTIHFNGNGNTSGSMSDQTGVTYDAATTITANAFVKTGYNFAGWATAADGDVVRADGAAHGNLTSTNGATVDLYAKWTAKSCDITFDFDESDAGYGSKIGATTDGTATYDAAMTSVTPPTAANGYAFMGYYTAADGGGTQYYDGSGNSAANWAVDTKEKTTLYAYYKKAEITALTFDAGTVEPEATVGVTPTISPTPEGETIICWTILYSNDTPLDPQPAMTWSDGKLTFAASAYSGTYKVQAVLRTGDACGAGDPLDTETASFLVAGSHSVTVNYKCSSDVIKTATSVTGRPTEWSDDITAPDIFGYTFSSWSSADGVTIKDSENEDVTSSTDATIKIKATYAGSLTANYTQNQMIFFKNTLGWENVYVNFYTASDWDNTDNGSGYPKGCGNNGLTNRNKTMTQYGETDIWYYDYEYNGGSSSITPTAYISFTDQSQNGVNEFWASNPGINVVYPANYADAISTDKSSENGFKAATPMFVPIAAQDPVLVNVGGGGRANYYNAGYWSKYTPGTGYVLEVYNSAGDEKLKTIEFESADDLMPMKAVADLEGGTTYKFQVRRGGESSAGVYYGNKGTMTYTNHGQDVAWDLTNTMSPSFTMAGITANAAGDYTFNLSYSAYHNESTDVDEYRLRIAVDYPVASGDYRLVYTDDVHTNPHPSAIVNKVNDGTDIVSFFVRHDQNPVVRIQQATVDGGTGEVTWNEYPNSGTPTNQITGPIASTISSSGTEVYNFNLSMNGSGALTVASAEVYDGNFYIRTDAASSKWDNYRTDPDHRMIYSEYSITHGGYTHYYTHWVDKDVTGRKNVKFCIANDYSPCISDTLAREEATGTWEHIADFMEEGGDLKRSANVRYMWDKRDNTISRAYVDGAQTAGTQFLTILSADEKILNPSTSEVQAITTFSDKGNWMYEANIKAKPGAQIKLKSSWGKAGETDHIIDQYFRGASDATEQLIGGSGSSPYDIRAIYDFKSNRLIAGLIPSGTIDEQMAIHADVMFVREHHGNIAQLTFAEKDSKMGAITDIETAYGVLQFNKWTINNKSKDEPHNPLSPLLSQFERDLFYVSFPFKVAMEDVFGFGTYGQHWIIEYYDGASRATNGYWAESGPNWKFVTNRKGKYFEPGQGYIIALDLDEMGESADIWANTDRVELYFPSYGTMDNITSSTATYEIPEHECTINRSNESNGHGGTLGPQYDRRVKDSHWNVLGVPTYVNPEAPNFANTDWTTEATETSIGPNFLYQWSMTDNTVSPVSASGYTYQAMHAYLVQYCGDVTWTSSVSVTPTSIVARRTYDEAPRSVEFRLELTQNDVAVDQTFVKLSDNEAVTTGFEFNYDLSKEFNKNRANIYTLIGTEQVAGNVLPLTDQTTVVPVGVKITSAGDYTFSLPDGTNGVGVILIDNVANTRTNLSVLDYTVNLTAGTHDGRFVLEISPIHNATTDIEAINDEGIKISGARKVLIDGILYIVKGDKLYDVRGTMIK